MKRLLRRITCVTDSTSPSSPSSCSLLLPRPKTSRGRRCRSYYTDPSSPVPAGHLPLRVEDPEGGGTSRRFVVPADLLTAPAIAVLLRRSAQEYGYEQSGVLRIPCPVELFQRVLDSLLAGGDLAAAAAGEEGCGLWDAVVVDDDDVGRDSSPEEKLRWSPGLHGRRGGAECGWCC